MAFFSARQLVTSRLEAFARFVDFGTRARARARHVWETTMDRDPRWAASVFQPPNSIRRGCGFAQAAGELVPAARRTRTLCVELIPPEFRSCNWAKAEDDDFRQWL